jgi:hypothetical protein
MSTADSGRLETDGQDVERDHDESFLWIKLRPNSQIKTSPNSQIMT